MKSPFLYRSRDYPLKLIVDIHSFCNARCTMCPYPRYSRQQTQGTMDGGLYEAIIEEMGRMGAQHQFRPLLTFCYMGEPFLAENLAGYVRGALDKKINVYLNTNAAAMTARQVEALRAAGFEGKIHISFHGISPEVYERITGLDYQNTLCNVHYLLDHYDRRKICIRGVDDHWPAGEHDKWVEYWRRYGVKLEYLPPISRCGAVGRLLPKHFREKDKMRLYGCRYHHPLVEMVILFDGRAVMCCQDMGRQVIWGDVGKEGLAGVWNGPVRRKLVERLYSGQASNKSFLCAQCEQVLTGRGMMGALLRTGWGKIVDRRS